MTPERAHMIKKQWRANYHLWDYKRHGPRFRVGIQPPLSAVVVSEEPMEPLTVPYVEFHHETGYFDHGPHRVWRIISEGLVVAEGRIA